MPILKEQIAAIDNKTNAQFTPMTPTAVSPVAPTKPVVSTTPTVDMQGVNLDALIKALGGNQTPTSGFSSSSTVQKGMDSNKAVNSTINNLSNPNPQPTPNKVQQEYMYKTGLGFSDISGIDNLSLYKEVSALREREKADLATQENTKMAKETLAAQTAAQNAAEDANFRSMLSRIEEQQKGSQEMAKNAAYGANPYADTSSATAGYKGAIDYKYNIVKQELNDKYSAAKSAIAAGDMKSYNEIISGMNTSLNKNLSTLNSTMNSLEDNRLNAVRMDETIKQNAQKDFMSTIESFAAAPQVENELDTYNTTGKLSPGLEMLIKQGEGAGYNANEVTAMIGYGTQKQRYQERQQDIQTAKMLAAQEKLTRDQRVASVIGNVGNVQSELFQKGVDSSSPEFAYTVGRASAGGLGVSTTQSDKYQTIIQLPKQLAEIKKDIDNVNLGEDVVNILRSKTGKSIQSLTGADLALLNGKINAIAAPIARALYGEKGTLAEGDIMRVMSSMPDGLGTKEVRNALYNGLVKLVADASNSMIVSDANNGRDVSSYSIYVKNLNDQVGKNLINSSVYIPGDISALLDKYQ